MAGSAYPCQHCPGEIFWQSALRWLNARLQRLAASLYQLGHLGERPGIWLEAELHAVVNQNP